MAINDTLWAGSTDDKLYLQSGQFTSTIKDSEDISAIDTTVGGVSWDGTNSPWCGIADDKLYLQSGQFTSTIKTSRSVNSIDASPNDVSWDGTNTPWTGTSGVKLYLQSGQFETTVKTSEDISSIDTIPRGISWDGFNTPWCGDQANKLYLQSGQFTSTVKTSEDVTSIDNVPSAVTWDGTNSPWIGNQADKLYLQSGQFTSTLKTSEDVSAVDAGCQGIETNDYDSRINPDLSTTGDVAITLPIITVSSAGHTEVISNITLPLFTVLGGFNPEAAITLPILTVNGLVSGDINASITLPIFTVNGVISGDVDGAFTFPILTVSSTGSETALATGSVTLPIIILSARAYNGSAPECVVMNAKNFAVSEYLNYGFNSMTRFNGANLVADQNGIYEQDTSDTDNAGVDDYKIKAHIKSGRIDTYGGAIQRLRNGWLNYQTDGDVKVVSAADKKATRTYELPFHSALSGINERRIKFERGIKHRHFDFKVANINGSQMEIDKLTITLEPIVSKRR